MISSNPAAHFLQILDLLSCLLSGTITNDYTNTNNRWSAQVAGYHAMS